MPEIIVSADSQQGAPILLREHVSEGALASDHYAAQLMERIGWAVVDASEAEAKTEPPGRGTTLAASVD